MALPRILQHNILAQAASVVASSTAAGYSVASLYDGLPHTWWKPNAATATLEVDAGVAVEADGLYIPAHTLDSSLCDVSVYGADLPFSGMQLFAAPEDLTNAAWTKNQVTVTANALAAPDGTTTADKVVETAVNAQHFWSQTYSVTAGVTYTHSFFAKPGEKTTVSVHFPTAFFGSGSPASVVFNLSTGAVTSVAGAGATASISALEANGYYRCTVTQAASSSGAATLYTAFGNLGTYTGDGTSGLYFWGAMLNTGSTAAPYIPVTAGRWISETALAYSNRIPNPWSASSLIYGAAAVVENTAFDPFGSRTADTVTDFSASVAQYREWLFSELHGAETGHAVGIYIRKTADDQTYASAQIVRATGGATEYHGPIINTNTGAITSVRGTPVAYGVEDAEDYWYCWVVAPLSVLGNSDVRLRFSPAYNTNGSITESLVATGSKIIWGAKLEKTTGRPAPYRTDAPLYLPFTATSKRYWLIRVNRKSGSALPAIGELVLGKALELPVGLPQGMDPIGRRVNGSKNRNERGQPLGRSVNFEEMRMRVSLEDVSWVWARNVFMPAWRRGLRSAPFGICWDYESHVEDVTLVTAGDDVAVPHKSAQRCTLSFEVSGVVT